MTCIHEYVKVNGNEILEEKVKKYLLNNGWIETESVFIGNTFYKKNTIDIRIRDLLIKEWYEYFIIDKWNIPLKVCLKCKNIKNYKLIDRKMKQIKKKY